jgi:hypothetical protein
MRFRSLLLDALALAGLGCRPPLTDLHPDLHITSLGGVRASNIVWGIVGGVA